MLETLIVTAVVVGLGREGDGAWRWSRERAKARLAAATDAIGRGLARLRAALPGTFARCVADVQGLSRDLLGTLDPKIRRKLEERIAPQLEEWLAPQLEERLAPQPEGGATASGAPGPARASGPETARHLREGTTTTPPAAPPTLSAALHSLQRRYLEGAISLEQYRREARRISAEPTLRLRGGSQRTAPELRGGGQRTAPELRGR